VSGFAQIVRMGRSIAKASSDTPHRKFLVFFCKAVNRFTAPAAGMGETPGNG
jgi:hypothetical protein